MIVSDQQLRVAVEWLRVNAEPAAKARAQRLFLEEELSALRARLARQGIDAGESVSTADVKAKASVAYSAALLTLRAAISEDELFRWRRSRADLVADVWRSEQATKRKEAYG